MIIAGIHSDVTASMLQSGLLGTLIAVLLQHTMISLKELVAAPVDGSRLTLPAALELGSLVKSPRRHLCEAVDAVILRPGSGPQARSYAFG